MKILNKNRFALIQFVLIFFLSTIIINGMNPEIQKIINDVKMKFAPDKRTAIFSVELKQKDGKNILKGEVNNIEAKNALLESLKKNNFSFVDSIELLPSKKLGDKVFGIVNISVANLRSEHKHPAELVTQATLGTVVNVLNQNRGASWFLIQAPNNYLGWVDDDGVFLVDEKAATDWKKGEKVIYISVYGFAYSQPDLNSQTISDLTVGNILLKLEAGNEFTKVKYPDGRIAYVKNNEIKNFNTWLNELNPTPASVVSIAKKFMGIPYLWGGTSAKGFDCSGFTKIVYFLSGAVLQRDASQQVLYGELVDTKNGFTNLKQGDLLFFGFKATDTTRERVTHVAIYIGDTEYIHAAGMVKINSLDSKRQNYSQFRLSTFLRARRILGSIGTEGIEKISENNFYR